jgi:DNA (cytosine-5)-methyltransferase 1
VPSAFDLSPQDTLRGSDPAGRIPRARQGSRGIVPVQQVLFPIEPSRPRNGRHTQQRSLRAAGLFAGIGGLELGLAAAGHETSLFCEIDEAARAVLGHRFPDIPCCDDIRELAALPADVDVITAGFPCQDLSQAGRTLGLAGSRSGLVGEVFRLLRRRPVPWVVLENVPFMLQLGKGHALDVIVKTFEELGYRWAYRVIDSRSFGLPQRRRRVYLVASLDEDPRSVLFGGDAQPIEGERDAATACGFYWTEGLRGLGWAVDAVPTLKGGSAVGIPSPPAIWLPSGRIVKPDIRDAERMQGFRQNWTRPAEEVARPGARWKLVGNAVSVPVAKWIGEGLATPRVFLRDIGIPLVRDGAWPTVAWNVGDGLRTAELTAWPVRRKSEPLVDFLRHEPTLLSERATAGFLGRAKKAKLRFPPGFIDALQQHLEAVRADTYARP